MAGVMPYVNGKPTNCAYKGCMQRLGPTCYKAAADDRFYCREECFDKAVRLETILEQGRAN